MPPINPNIKQVPVTSPIKGVNRVVNREGQLPDTCWDALNVLPFDRYGRKRVSQRPGLVGYRSPPSDPSHFIQNLLAINNIFYPGTAGTTTPVAFISAITATTSSVVSSTAVFGINPGGMTVPSPYSLTFPPTALSTASGNTPAITVVANGELFSANVNFSLPVASGTTRTLTMFLTVSQNNTVVRTTSNLTYNVYNSGGSNSVLTGILTFVISATGTITATMTVSAVTNINTPITPGTVSTSTFATAATGPYEVELAAAALPPYLPASAIGPAAIAVPPSASTVGSATYNTLFTVVRGGNVYIGSSIFDPFLAGGTNGILKTHTPVASARVFQEVYFVDGATIAQLDLPTDAMVPYQTTAGSTPNSTTGSTTYTLTTGNLNSSGTVAGVTTPTPNNWTVGDTVTIAGATPTGYNGTVQILAVGSPTFFTYTLPNGGTGLTSPATGTITVTGPYIGALTTCCLACTWRGRLVLAGDSGNPQNFYMSRVNVPTDWNYGATDGAQAVAGNLATLGSIGEPITCLIPYTDDIMLIGCTHSIWMIQGDLAQNGTVVPISANVGIVGANAWCKDSFDALFFLGTNGLYTCRPLWEQWQPPKLLTGENYNQYFVALNPSTNFLTLVWDEDLRYVYVFATPTDDLTQGTHLIWDTRNEGLWPMQYPLQFGPTASILFFADGNPANRGVLIGTWQGEILKTNLLALDDGGVPISCSVTFGPFHPFPDAALLSGLTIDFGEINPTQTGPLPLLIPNDPFWGELGTNDTSFTGAFEPVLPLPISVSVGDIVQDPSTYTISGLGQQEEPVVTFNTPPFPGGTGLIEVTYYLQQSFFGPVTTFFSDTPSGAIDGVNKQFQLSESGTVLFSFPMMVTVNGIAKVYGTDFAEAPDGSQDILFVVAPPTGATIVATYDFLPFNSDGQAFESWNAEITTNVGPDAYTVTEGTPHTFATVTSMTDRRQKTFRQRMRGGWFSVQISNTVDSTYFSFESAILEFTESGRNRYQR